MSDQDRTDRPEMTQNLPVLVGPRAERPSFARYSLPASFVSHLIAERDRMAMQRTRNRATPDIANNAYKTGSSISTKRMPSGFRHTSTI